MYAHHAYVHVSDASTYSSADDAASAFVAVNPPFLLFPFSSNGHTSEDMDEDDMDDIRIVRSQLTLSLPDSPSLLLVLLLPLCMPLPPHVMPRTFALILCVTPRVARPPRCISLGGIFLSVAVSLSLLPRYPLSSTKPARKQQLNEIRSTAGDPLRTWGLCFQEDLLFSSNK